MFEDNERIEGELDPKEMVKKSIEKVPPRLLLIMGIFVAILFVVAGIRIAENSEEKEAKEHNQAIQQAGPNTERLIKEAALSQKKMLDPRVLPEESFPTFKEPPKPQAEKDYFFGADQAEAKSLEPKVRLLVLEGGRPKFEPEKGLHGDNAEQLGSLEREVGEFLQANALNGLAAGSPEARDPNYWNEKDRFWAAKREASETGIVRTKSRQLPARTVSKGTLIPATMITGIKSDLQGPATAMVRRDVYDHYGTRVVIPKGTKLYGEYDKKVAWGQRRVLLAWTRLNFPDGQLYDIPATPSADSHGQAGLEDGVNNHYLRIFGSAFLISIISAGNQLAQPEERHSGLISTPSEEEIAAGAIGEEMASAANKLLDKNLNVAPTLTVRPGYNFVLVAVDDLLVEGG